MTGFAPVDPAASTGKAAEPLADVQRTLGVTPNTTEVMANSPALLQGCLAAPGAPAGGVPPAPVRERLAPATAEHNGCEYRPSAHTHIGAHIAEVDADEPEADELEAARDAKASDPHAGALPTLSDAEIGEVVGHLALNALTDHFDIPAEVDNDWPVVTPRRAA